MRRDRAPPHYVSRAWGLIIVAFATAVRFQFAFDFLQPFGSAFQFRLPAFQLLFPVIELPDAAFEAVRRFSRAPGFAFTLAGFAFT